MLTAIMARRLADGNPRAREAYPDVFRVGGPGDDRGRRDLERENPP
jgi:hypothetical protein